MLLEGTLEKEGYAEGVFLEGLSPEVDTSGDGIIDSEEFGQLLKNPKLQLWLHQRLDKETL